MFRVRDRLGVQGGLFQSVPCEALESKSGTQQASGGANSAGAQNLGFKDLLYRGKGLEYPAAPTPRFGYIAARIEP